MRTTWIHALIAFAAALVLAVTACPSSPPATTVPDAPPCDLESCAAGMALECCPPLAPPVSTQRTAVISSLHGAIRDGWAIDWSGFAGTATGCMHSSGFGGRFALAVPLVEGDRMLSLTLAMIGNGSADVTVTSAAVAPNGDRFLGTVGSLTQPNAPPAWVDYTIDLTDTVIAGGNSHWFEFGADQPGLCIGALRLTYDHP